MIEIAFMNAVHVPQIAQIERLCFNDPWSERSIAAELSCKLSLWLVALDGERVVGYVGSQTVLDQADMMNLAVHPEYRRQGIGLMLTRRVCEELIKKGVNALLLEVRASNAPAKALYEGMGFTVAGVRPNYYRNPREDAFIMRKEL